MNLQYSGIWFSKSNQEKLHWAFTWEHVYLPLTLRHVELYYKQVCCLKKGFTDYIVTINAPLGH